MTIDDRRSLRMDVFGNALSSSNAQVETVRFLRGDGALDGAIEYRNVVGMDSHEDIGEVRFVHAGGKTEDVKSLFRPTKCVTANIVNPTADARELLDLAE